MKSKLAHMLTTGCCVVLVLAGCAGLKTRHVGPTPLLKTQAEIDEGRLLDVGIRVFDPGEITTAQTREKTANPDIRKAESHFIPYHLKNTLQQSSYWGAVRVLPAETDSVDVTVRGNILASNGKHLSVEIDVADAAQRKWFSKTYRSKASQAFYSGNRAGEKDAFQDVYNAINNDMVAYLNKLTAAEVQDIRKIAKLKFAENFAPAAFEGYLVKNRRGTITINRLPSENDPMIDRLLKIREREYMFIDTLNEYYETYYNEMWPSYENWRKLNYEELQAIQKIKQDAGLRIAGGLLMVIGAVMLGGDSDVTRALQVGMIMVGSQIFIDGINITKQAEIHSAAIKELGESFGSEMRPVVIDFEGKQYELTGSAEEQFKRWRELLRQIYYEETGFAPPDATDDKDGLELKPAGQPARE